MSRPTVGSLTARVDALEAGPLSVGETFELLGLEADFRRQFPCAVGEMSDVEVAGYLAFVASDSATRMHQLRRRARTPAQVEADRVEGERIAAMSDEEVDLYLHAPKGVPAWNS